MIPTLIIFVNLLSPITPQIKISASQTIMATYNNKLDMMFLTKKDFTEVKSIIELNKAVCGTEKKAIESECSSQLTRSLLGCLSRVETLTNSLKNIKAQNLLLKDQNQSLKSKLKWIGISSGILVGVSAYFFIIR